MTVTTMDTDSDDFTTNRSKRKRKAMEIKRQQLSTLSIPCRPDLSQQSSADVMIPDTPLSQQRVLPFSCWFSTLQQLLETNTQHAHTEQEEEDNSLYIHTQLHTQTQIDASVEINLSMIDLPTGNSQKLLTPAHTQQYSHTQQTSQYTAQLSTQWTQMESPAVPDLSLKPPASSSAQATLTLPSCLSRLPSFHLPALACPFVSLLNPSEELSVLYSQMTDVLTTLSTCRRDLYRFHLVLNARHALSLYAQRTGGIGRVSALAEQPGCTKDIIEYVRAFDATEYKQQHNCTHTTTSTQNDHPCTPARDPSNASNVFSSLLFSAAGSPSAFSPSLQSSSCHKNSRWIYPTPVTPHC